MSGAGEDSTRRRILDAGCQVFAQHGYMGASLGDVARLAGLTSGSIYSNFAGKRELFLACTLESLQRIPGLPEHPTVQQYTDACLEFLDQVHDEPHVFRLIAWAMLVTARRATSRHSAGASGRLGGTQRDATHGFCLGVRLACRVGNDRAGDASRRRATGGDCRG